MKLIKTFLTIALIIGVIYAFKQEINAQQDFNSSLDQLIDGQSWNQQQRLIKLKFKRTQDQVQSEVQH